MEKSILADDRQMMMNDTRNTNVDASRGNGKAEQQDENEDKHKDKDEDRTKLQKMVADAEKEDLLVYNEEATTFKKTLPDFVDDQLRYGDDCGIEWPSDRMLNTKDAIGLPVLTVCCARIW